MCVIAVGETSSSVFPFLSKRKSCWNTLRYFNLFTMERFFGGGPAPESRSQRAVEINDVAVSGRRGHVTANLFCNFAGKSPNFCIF